MSEYAPWNDDVKVSMRWHPRLTPFRLAFIISTAMLGIAKAVLVSKDETISSTTVEWVTSVVLALFFQLLSPLEPRERHNRFARFVFSQDCLTPLWKIFPRPSYIDDERPVKGSPETLDDFTDVQKYHLQLDAVVTPYRLLVFGVTAGFGVVKMICSYTGLDTTMNAVDWAFSVPVVLSLYYVGLYEDNTVGIGRKFFEVDCSQSLIFVITQASYLLLISGGCIFVPYWFDHWYSTAILAINLPLTMLDTQLENDPIPPWVHKLHDQSFTILAAFAMTVYALPGVIPIIFLMIYFSGPVSKAVRWMSARVRRLVPANALLSKIASGLGAAGATVHPYAVSFLTNLVIVSFYALAAFLFFDLGVFVLSLDLCFFSSLYLQTDIVVLKVVDAMMGLVLGAGSYAPLRGGFVMLKELLRRLSLSARRRQGYFLIP